MAKNKQKSTKKAAPKKAKSKIKVNKAKKVAKDAESDDESAEESKNGNNRPRGENHPRAKMTDEQVAKARRLWKKGKMTQRALAAKYDVAVTYMHKILHGQARA